MRLVPLPCWSIDGDPVPLDARLPALLGAVTEHGTLAAACEHLGLAYRSGWELLRQAEARLGVALVDLERGRGASLAPAGLALLHADAQARRRLGAAHVELASAREAREETLAIAASHDLALAQLRDALPAAGVLRLAIAFMGSLEALAAFARGEVALAGFHVPSEGAEPALLRPFQRALKARRDRLIGFAEREQGLILPPGNPRRVRTFADLAAKRLRFVNRQPGSGTRVLVDGLISRAGVRAAGIAGYDRVERNHLAVAAAVASGHADAGFGLRAAAAEFGLAFVPLARERYLFAVRGDALEQPAVREFVALLRGPLARRALGALPGYATRDTGEILPVGAIAA